MVRPASWFWGVAALMVLAGCVPRMNPKFIPAQGEPRMVKGDAWTEQTRDGITVAVANTHADFGDLHFSMEVSNGGARPLLLTPEVLEVTLTPEGGARTFMALDPERKIRDLIFMEECEKRKMRQDAVFMGVFAVMDAADTVANTSKRTQEENRKIREDRTDTYRDGARSQNTAVHLLSSYERERMTWERDVFRRTTLDPGQRLRGTVRFALDASRAGTLVLRVPVEGKVFEFPFNAKPGE